MEVINKSEAERVGNHLLSYPQVRMGKQKSSPRALQIQAITTGIFAEEPASALF